MKAEYFQRLRKGDVPIQYQTTNVRQRGVAKQQSYKKLPLNIPTGT